MMVFLCFTVEPLELGSTGMPEIFSEVQLI